MRALMILGGAGGGLGGYIGAKLSSEYDGWPGFGYLAVVILGLIMLGLLWQFLFFTLLPRSDRAGHLVLPWGPVEPPQVKLRARSEESSTIGVETGKQGRTPQP